MDKKASLENSLVNSSIRTDENLEREFNYRIGQLQIINFVLNEINMLEEVNNEVDSD